MANLMRMPVELKHIKNYKQVRDKFDNCDSYSVVCLLNHYKLSQVDLRNDIKIIFENDNNETSKACCNEKCIIF